MIDFKCIDESVSASRLLVAVALIMATGCASVQDRGFDRDSRLQAPSPAAADDRKVQHRCPIRHMYVCDRKSRTLPAICYCTPEPDILQTGADGARLF